MEALEAAGEGDMGSVAVDVNPGVDAVGSGQLHPGHHLLRRLEPVTPGRRRGRRQFTHPRRDGLEREPEAVELRPRGLRAGPDGDGPVPR